MDRFVEKKDKIAECLFFAGISIELVFMLVNLGSYSIPGWINVGRFMQLASLFFLCKILLTKYTKRELCVMAFLFVFGLVSYIATGRDEWVLRVVFLVVSSKNIDIDKVISYIFYISLVGTIVIMTLSYIGLGAPLVNELDYGRGVGVERRWTFGMGHPNHTHGQFCYLASLLFYKYRNRLKWYVYLVLSLLNIVLFIFTNSRTGFLVSQFLICLVCLISYWKVLKNGKILLAIALMSIIGTVTFTIFVGKYGVHGVFLETLDRLLTYRLTFIDWYGDPETWRWFSQADDIGRATIDVAYGAMINAYGYAVMILYVVMSCLMAWRFYKDKNSIALAILISCTLYGMMENYINSYFLMYNLIFIFLIGNWNRMIWNNGE